MKKSDITYILEITKQCNNNCKYCYNVWKANPSYPDKELNIEEWRAIIDKLILETQPRLFTISGGEPLMKEGFEHVLAQISKYNIPINFITNGTLITDDIIKKCLKYGVVNFELPILGSNPKTHDSLTQNNGSWEKVIENIQKIKKLKGRATAVFVLNKQNISEIKEMTEIAIALADGLLVNFFNVGGMGIKYKNELTITAPELEKALSTIDQLTAEYEVRAGCGIPLPQCVLDTSKFKNIRFGNCPIGGQNTYYTIDPAGNFRLCNHSELILGNVLKQKVKEILESEIAQNYISNTPAECAGCDLIKKCRGGCRASAEVYYHDTTKLNPFIKENFKGIIKNSPK